MLLSVFLPTVLPMMGLCTTNPVRIVVLPMHMESGGRLTAHNHDAGQYRRVIGIISRNLVEKGFEVINPYARENAEISFDKTMERSLEDSAMSINDLSRKFAVDAVYVISIDIHKSETSDNYCKATTRITGEGYDSSARDLGVGISESAGAIKRTCDAAVNDAVETMAEVAANALTGLNFSAAVSSDNKKSTALEKNARELETLVNIRLDGAAGYEMVEVFGKILNSARGVENAKRYAMRLETDNPQASYSVWRLRIKGTEPFRLQANIMKMMDDVIAADGELTMKDVPYRYSPNEISLLKAIQPKDASATEIRFIVDNNRVRQKN